MLWVWDSMKLKKTITFFQMSKDNSVNSLTDLFSDPHSKAFPIVNIKKQPPSPAPPPLHNSCIKEQTTSWNKHNNNNNHHHQHIYFKIHNAFLLQLSNSEKLWRRSGEEILILQKKKGLSACLQYPEMGIILKWKKILRSKLTKEAFILKKTTKFSFKFLKNSSTRSEHAVTLKLGCSRNLQQISDGTVVLFYSFQFRSWRRSGEEILKKRLKD